MAIRRSAFAKVGLFDPRLGAGASGCSEDSELWFRLLHTGLICHYDPAVVVEHFHRADMVGLYGQMKAYMTGHVVALLVQFAQDRRFCHLFRIFVTLPLYYLRRTLRAVILRDRIALRLVGAQVRGFLSSPFEAVRQLRSPGPPPLSSVVASTS
jgi:GT2 family glycosyltransferase